MASADAIVTDVMEELNGRGGFDHWWGNIDPDIQKEIGEDLRTLVHTHLVGHQPENLPANTIKEVVVVRKGESKRLHDAHAITEDGYKCRLPLTGVSYNEAFGDNGHVALVVGGHRVTFKDID